jgi:hypothetical protein
MIAGSERFSACEKSSPHHGSDGFDLGSLLGAAQQLRPSPKGAAQTESQRSMPSGGDEQAK